MMIITSEVDFLFSHEANVIPVEAKAGLNVHAQSLKVYEKIRSSDSCQDFFAAFQKGWLLAEFAFI